MERAAAVGSDALRVVGAIRQELRRGGFGRHRVGPAHDVRVGRGGGRVCAEIPRLGRGVRTEEPVSLRRAWALGVLALVGLATAGIRLRLLDIPLDRDEGEYAYFGQLLLRGIPPYAQAYNFKMPGIYAVYALILAAFGQTPAGIHLGLLVVNVVTIALVFLVARRHFDARVAVVAAAAFAALSLSPRLLSTAAYAEHFVLPPVLAGLLILPRAIDRRSMAAYLGSGALFGTAFVVKQSAGAFLLFAVLYVLLGMRDDTRLRLAASAALVAGALGPVAAGWLLLLPWGDLSYFFGFGPFSRGPKTPPPPPPPGRVELFYRRPLQ